MTTLLPADDAPREVLFLPTLLQAVLERRYLATLDAANWAFQTTAADALPSLHEVTTLGSHNDTNAMASALAVSHDPGQTIVAALCNHADADRTQHYRLYYGARRRSGGASGPDYLASQAETLTALFPGMQLTPARSLRDCAPLAACLTQAPALTAMTGIPYVGGEQPKGFDWLTRTMGQANYAVVVVAEALPLAFSDHALDACRHLQTDISSLITRQESRSHSRTESEDTTPVTEPHKYHNLPRYLQQCATFLTAAYGMPWLSAVALGSSLWTDRLRGQRSDPPPRTSRTEGWTDATTTTTVDAHARACEQILAQHASRLGAGRGWGWWRVAIYIAAHRDATQHAVVRALRAASAGDPVGLEPMQSYALSSSSLLREAMYAGRIVTMQPTTSSTPHPLGATFDALATCLTSEELATLLAPPRRPLPGLWLRERGDFPTTIATPEAPSFELGTLRDASGQEHGPVRLTAQNLNEHVLVVGMPGYGKTNTCMRMLTQAYEQFQVPFLVVEPSKTEYRRLSTHPTFANILRVYVIGGEGQPTFRLNPLAPVPGAPLLGHIDLLKAVFNASFAMHPGMPQILEQALLDVYEERGWNLHTGTNAFLPTDPTDDDRAALLPCLADLYAQIAVVVERKGYGGEVRQNMGAALQSRIQGLMLGAKGACLNTRRSLPMEDLFEKPVVLEFDNIKGDEQAFMLSIIFMMLAQYCKVRQASRPVEALERLQHITLIEEAHRLLAATTGHAAADVADPRGEAVALFTDMLAELRALGEGFIIAEQIPTKLAPDVLKNTNLKVLHRLTAPADRQIVAQSANLNAAQEKQLAALSKGLTVVHGLAASANAPVADAALVQIHALKDGLAKVVAPTLPVRSHAWFFKHHRGCDSCPQPCAFFHLVEPDLRREPCPSWVRRLAETISFGDAETTRQTWDEHVVPVRNHGALYCHLVQALHHWLMDVLTFRRRPQEGLATLRPTDRLTIDRLAGAFGVFVRTWLDQPVPSSTTTSAFTVLHDALRAEFDATRPSAAGCATCPAPCQWGAVVAGMPLQELSVPLTQVLPAGTFDAFRSPVAVASFLTPLSKVFGSLEARWPLPVLANDPVRQRHWRYCVLTHVPLPADRTEQRKAMLNFLRLPNQPPTKPS